MEEEVIKLAKKLISFKTITPNDDGIIDFLINYLEPYGFICQKLVFEDVINLYARYGKQSPNFCFAGHTDVVPTGDGWSLNPFEPIIKNGYLYGRGASDMKAALAAQLISVIEFIQNNNFNGSISFLITGDEEAEAKNGTVKVLECLKQQKEAINGCIVGEPTSADQFGDIIKYGRRGSISFELAVHGKQGHVAYPHLAENPIYPLIKILSLLKEHILDYGNKDFIASNLEVTDIYIGNDASNVIPKKAKAKINIRFNNIHTALSLKKWVNNVCRGITSEYDLKITSIADAFVTRKDSTIVKKLKSAVSNVIDFNPQLSTTGGTSDARFIKDFCEVIEFGLLNKTAHHIDEHVLVEDIIKLKNIYKIFLQKYFYELD